jgi:hypothetical protein
MTTTKLDPLDQQEPADAQGVAAFEVEEQHPA